MFLSREELEDLKSKLESGDELISSIDLVDNAISLSKSSNPLKNLMQDLFFYRAGDKQAGLFNKATVRGGTLLLMDSWNLDLDEITALFDALKKSLQKNDRNSSLTACKEIIRKSNALGRSIFLILEELCYEHKLNSSKELSQDESRIASWIA